VIKKIILIGLLLLPLPAFSAGQWKVNIQDAEIEAFIGQIADMSIPVLRAE